VSGSNLDLEAGREGLGGNLELTVKVQREAGEK